MTSADLPRHVFGSTGVLVPKVGLGTWYLEQSDPKTAIAAVQQAIELGLTHIDTAELYGSGKAETLVGQALEGRRDNVFLVSKIIPSNASRQGTRQHCEQTLKRLKTDHLDCYLLHWPGAYPLEETIAALEELVQAGKTRAWGVSNFDEGELTNALAIAGPGRIACNQVLYHLEERSIEHAVLPWCEQHGVAVVGYTPYGQHRKYPPPGAAGAVLGHIADRAHATARQVALAFLTRRPGLFAIPKSTNSAHLRENADGAKLELSEQDIAAIDRAFPVGRRRRGVPDAVAEPPRRIAGGKRRDIKRSLGYLGYYFVWLALAYLIRQPWLLVGLVGLWLLRGVLPSPGALFGALSRAGRLRQQVGLNRANITARRDLATIYLNLKRPKRALPLLEEGLALSPGDPELMYLYGFSLHRAGRHDEALAQLLPAIEKDPRLRHGAPYFAAGDTLLALQRWDDAADAVERFLDFNGSDVAARTQLARAHAGHGDLPAARRWLKSGVDAWHGLPGALKRRQFGAYLGAQWARVTVLKDTVAITFVVVLVLLVAGAAHAAYPLVARLWQPNQDDEQALFARLKQGIALCGTQQTGDFVGNYDATPELGGDGSSLVSRRWTERQRARFQKAMAERYSDFRIEHDRIRMGREAVQELCLTKVISRTPTSLHAEALQGWREGGDDADLGQTSFSSIVDVRLDRGSESTRLTYAPLGQPLARTLITLHRRE